MAKLESFGWERNSYKIADIMCNELLELLPSLSLSRMIQAKHRKTVKYNKHSQLIQNHFATSS